MIYVIATIDAAKGKGDDVLAEFRRLVPLVRAEAGCIEYNPSIDVASGLTLQIPMRDHTVTVVEKWESVEALKAHAAAPHMVEYRERVKGLVTSVQLQVLEPA